MKKRMLAMLLVFVMVVGLLPTAAMASGVVTNPDASNLPQSDGNTLRLWYDEPVGSASWTNRCLPLGNGHTGGLTYGEIVKDRLHVNEKTLWGGKPISDPHSLDDYTFDYDALEAQRQKMDDHSTSVFPVGTGTPYGMGNKSDASMGSYQDLGDIYFDFAAAGLTTEVANYVRDLDLRTAVSSVNFDLDGVHYEREYLASYPDDVMVSHFTASENGKISFTASLSTASSGLSATATADGAIMYMTGVLGGSGEKWLFMAGVTAEGGTVTANEDGTITVSGANEATVYVHTATDYLPEYPDYTDGRDMDTIIADGKTVVNAAMEKGYAAVREAHVADHSALFSRVELDLGGECPTVPTDELMAAYRNGDYNHAVEEMAFQMGRYMTIAASREGDELPTNLCGIWLVGGAGAYWGADFHFNVNVQMNYWPAYTTNLAECGSVFNDYVKSLVIPGRLTAAVCNGVKTEDYMNTPLGEGNGFMINTQVNSWGHTWPIGSQEYGWNIGGSSWAMQNLNDYYLFTGDEAYLEDTLYPMLKEMATFWDNYLWWSDYQQRWVVGPSVSAEQGPTVNGTTYDQSLVWEVYKMAISASETLGVDEDLRAGWKAKMDGLNPVIIGDEGQVKEWFEESRTGYGQVEDLDEVRIPNFGAGGGSNYGSLHRHTSQLIGLYPGTLINKDTEEWMEAAIKTLELRTLNGTGWSRAHKLNMYARTGLSNESYQLVQKTCAGNSNGLLDNLFGSHPPYQIDCNFGLTAGMAEMLIQSHLGYTQFLPTLPAEWATGSVTGLVARGNFVVDMAWTDGKADKFTITSRNGGTFAGEYADLAGYTVQDSAGNPVPTTALSKDKISFETVAGETYTIDFDGADQLSVQKTVAAVLAASMTDDRLAVAKETLTNAAATATDADALAAANATASAAMEFLTDIDEAKAFYDEKQDAASSSAQAANALEQLNGKIAAAEALLNNAAATAEQFDAQAKVLSTAMSDVTDVLTVYQIFVDKIGETEAFYEENEALGENWSDAAALMKTLAKDLDAAKALLENAATTAADFTAAMETLNSDMTAVNRLVSSVNLTLTAADGKLTMSVNDDEFEIRYTTDGNAPSVISKLYTGPVTIGEPPVMIKAQLFIGGKAFGDVKTYSVSGSSSENVALNKTATSSDADWGASYRPSAAVDGNMNTRWAPKVDLASMTIDLGETYTINGGAIYETAYTGRVQKFEIQVSDDNAAWTTVYTGTAMGVFSFGEVDARYVRYVTKASNGQPNIGEIEIYEAVKLPTGADKTALGELITEAEAARASEGYANATAAEKDRFETVLEAAKGVYATESSNAETISEAMTALTEAMAPFGVLSADTLLAMLDTQLTAAKELAATITDAQTLSFLQAVIDAAEQAKAAGATEQYYSHTTALKNAIVRANAAVGTVDALAAAKAVYAEYEPQAGGWNAGQDAVADLADAIAEAETALADANAASMTLKSAAYRLNTAGQAVKDVFASINLSISVSDGAAVMTASDEQFEIRYTIDGNTPSVISKVYTAPVELPTKALTVRAQLFIGQQAYGKVVSYSIMGTNVALGKTATSPNDDWSGFFGTNANYQPKHAVDGTRSTAWSPRANLAEMTVDLGQIYTIDSGAIYGDSYNRIKGYDIQVRATENDAWTTVYQGTGLNVTFNFEAVEARYVRYVTTSATGEPNVDELEIYAVPENGNAADFTALNAAIAEAEEVKNGAYKTADEAAQKNFDAYLQIAKEVAANAGSEQDTVDAAEAALREAISTLVVVLNLKGEEATTVDADKLTYTVSAGNTSGLATATLTMEIGGKVTAPEVEALNGWFLIAQTYADGKLTVVMCNQAGVSGEADILSVTVKTTGEVGEATVAITKAVLSAYVGGNDETYVNTVYADAKVTTVLDYSIYDVNRDGIVDQLDLTRCQRFYGMTADDEGWYAYADVNRDGMVDISDMILILNNYRK